MTKKIVSCLFALVLLLGCVFPAAALEIHIDNSQALGGSLALRYPVSYTHLTLPTILRV